MADAVSTAIYAMGLDASQYVRNADAAVQAGDKVVASAERIAVAEEKVTKATRTTSDGFGRLEARYDPLIRAEQRRLAAIAQANRHLQEGTVTGERHAAQLARINAHYDQQVARVRQSSGAFGEQSAVVGGLSRVLGAFGVTLGLAGLVAFGRNVFSSVAALQDQAEQLGVTTDALQVYTFGAEQSGLKQEQLNNAIAKFTRTVGEANEGNDKAIDRFNRLGVGVLDAGGKLRSTEAILEDVARAIAAIEDPQAKATAAADLFGDKLGQKVIPLLGELAQGYDKMNAKAREAGAVLDKELIARFDKAEDRLQKLWRTTVGYGAIALNFLIDRLGDVGDALSGASRALGRFGVLGVAAAEQAPPIPGPHLALDDGGSGGGGVTGGGGGGGFAGGTSNPLSDSARRREQSLDKYLASLETAARAEGLVATEKARALAIAEAEAKLTDDKGVRLREITDLERQRVVAALELNEAGKRDASVRQHILGLEIEANSIIVGQGVERDIQRALIAAQNRLLDDQGNKLRDLTPLERDRIEAAVRVKDAYDAQKQALAEVEAFGERAFDRIGASITQLFVEGKGAAFDWRNVMKGVLSEVAQEFFKLATINPLKNALFGGNAATLSSVGGLFGGLFGNSGPGALAPSTGGIFDFAFHAGGVVGVDNAPMRMVEPRLFAAAPRLHSGLGADEFPAILQRGERVIPRGGGATTLSVTYAPVINAQGASPAVLPAIAAMLEKNKRETVAQVYEIMRRGGRESQAAGLKH